MASCRRRLLLPRQAAGCQRGQAYVQVRPLIALRVGLRRLLAVQHSASNTLCRVICAGPATTEGEDMTMGAASSHTSVDAQDALDSLPAYGAGVAGLERLLGTLGAHTPAAGASSQTSR